MLMASSAERRSAVAGVHLDLELLGVVDRGGRRSHRLARAEERDRQRDGDGHLGDRGGGPALAAQRVAHPHARRAGEQAGAGQDPVQPSGSVVKQRPVVEHVGHRPAHGPAQSREGRSAPPGEVRPAGWPPPLVRRWRTPCAR